MKQYDVAAYIWPAYTGDEPRSRIFWPEGMGEWETVREAKPKFPGHQWPRVPRWGYMNEADPAVMEMQINQATRHGVNVFIYDWYWFDRRPFLENCLDDGFLKAPNTGKMKFYLMWANHDANAYWDRRLSSSQSGQTTLWSGRVNRQDFEEMAIRLVDKYFGIDNYYRIDDKPVFMIYELANLIQGFGSVEATADALSWFRGMVKSKGYPGVHLQLCVRGDRNMNLTGIDGGSVTSYSQTVKTLGADSFTHYGYFQITNPNGDYETLLGEIRREYEKIDREYETLYFPHASIGWDNNPRFSMEDIHARITTNNGPDAFEKGLRLAKEYADSHELPVPLITLNAWNEWTEASYLQPDNLYGYGYLEAVKKVFVDQE